MWWQQQSLLLTDLRSKGLKTGLWGAMGVVHSCNQDERMKTLETKVVAGKGGVGREGRSKQDVVGCNHWLLCAAGGVQW